LIDADFSKNEKLTVATTSTFNPNYRYPKSAILKKLDGGVRERE
jgi:hypothetical protein